MGTAADWFDTAFSDQRVMAILRGYDPDRSVRMAGRAWDLGLDWVEVPIQTPDAVPSLRAVICAARDRGRQVGAGTVVTEDQVAVAADCGVAFTVAPGFDPDVARACRDRDLPHLPGVATAGEIQRANAAGLRWLKAFPATVLGPGWFQAMAGPFPGVPLVATGGLTAHNCAEYLAAGARVVGVGSALADDHQLALLAELLGREVR